MIQIDFVGSNEFSGGPFIAIDDVAFSKEPCKQIPWKAVEGEIKNEFPKPEVILRVSPI